MCVSTKNDNLWETWFDNVLSYLWYLKKCTQKCTIQCNSFDPIGYIWLDLILAVYLMTLCVCIGLCVSNVYNIWISTYNANVNIVYISTVHSVQQYKHNLISCSPTHSLTHEFIHLFPAQNSLHVRKSARLIHPLIHFLFLSKLSAWRVLDRGFKTHSGLQVSKKQNCFFPSQTFNIVWSLRDREVACWASDRQGSNFESCVWRAVSSHSSLRPQLTLMAQFSLYVHEGGLKPHSLHFACAKKCTSHLSIQFLFLLLLNLNALGESDIVYTVCIPVIPSLSCFFCVFGGSYRIMSHLPTSSFLLRVCLLLLYNAHLSLYPCFFFILSLLDVTMPRAAKWTK